MNLLEERNALLNALKGVLKLKISNCKTTCKAKNLLYRIKDEPRNDYYDKIHLKVEKDVSEMKKNGNVKITSEDIDRMISVAINDSSK